MGFMDTLFGRGKKISKPRVDALFRLSTTLFTIQREFRADRSGYAGVCFRPLSDASFSDTQKEISDLLNINDFGTKYRIRQDDFGYSWFVLYDRDFEELITLIHMASQVFIDNGYGKQILCAAFEFEISHKAFFLIYNYKRGKFYPFVPQDEADKTREHSVELKLKAQLDEELPIESKLEEWYPLWGIPFHD